MKKEEKDLYLLEFAKEIVDHYIIKGDTETHCLYCGSFKNHDNNCIAKKALQVLKEAQTWLEDKE